LNNNYSRNPAAIKSVLPVAVETEKEANMPVFLVPALWVAGTAVVLGGGYWIGHAQHWF
jgi:hypothetical protein